MGKWRAVTAVLKSWLPDILAVAGAACIAAAAYMLCTALGTAVIGVSCIAAAVIISRGGDAG